MLLHKAWRPRGCSGSLPGTISVGAAMAASALASAMGCAFWARKAVVAATLAASIRAACPGSLTQLRRERLVERHQRRRAFSAGSLTGRSHDLHRRDLGRGQSAIRARIDGRPQHKTRRVAGNAGQSAGPPPSPSTFRQSPRARCAGCAAGRADHRPADPSSARPRSATDRCPQIRSQHLQRVGKRTHSDKRGSMIGKPAVQEHQRSAPSQRLGVQPHALAFKPEVLRRRQGGPAAGIRSLGSSWSCLLWKQVANRKVHRGT